VSLAVWQWLGFIAVGAGVFGITTRLDFGGDEDWGSA
jgi:hypothetical protein